MAEPSLLPKEGGYKAQIGFICDNEKNLSFETRRAIYVLVRSAHEQEAHGSEEVIIENLAQNVSWVRLDRLSADTLSTICSIVKSQRDQLNQPARP